MRAALVFLEFDGVEALRREAFKYLDLELGGEVGKKGYNAATNGI